MQIKSKLFYLLPIIGEILTFFICSITLNPGYGLSDNGDFYRIMKKRGDDPLEDWSSDEDN